MIRKKSQSNSNKYKKSFFSPGLIAIFYPEDSKLKEVLLTKFKEEQDDLRNKADYLEQRECNEEQQQLQL